MAVQGIDTSVLLNAFRQGKADRAAEDAAKAEAAAQEHRRSVMERLFAPQAAPAGGVEGQMGVTPAGGADTGGVSPAPAAPAAAEGVTGLAPSPAPAAAPGAAPPAPRSSFELNPDALKELTVIDPEMGMKIYEAFGKMSKGQMEKSAAANIAVGQGAYYLSRVPPAERPAAFQNLIPHFRESGLTDEQIGGAFQQLQQANFSDEFLGLQIARTGDLDKMMGKIMEEREFQLGKTVNFGPESGVMRLLPDGSKVVEAVPGPQGVKPGQPAADVSAIPPDAIAALRSGAGTPEEFNAIFGPGAAEAILGGAGGNASVNFPGP